MATIWTSARAWLVARVVPEHVVVTARCSKPFTAERPTRGQRVATPPPDPFLRRISGTSVSIAPLIASRAPCTPPSSIPKRAPETWAYSILMHHGRHHRHLEWGPRASAPAAESRLDVPRWTCPPLRRRAGSDLALDGTGEARGLSPSPGRVSFPAWSSSPLAGPGDQGSSTHAKLPGAYRLRRERARSQGAPLFACLRFRRHVLAPHARHLAAGERERPCGAGLRRAHLRRQRFGGDQRPALIARSPTGVAVRTPDLRVAAADEGHEPRRRFCCTRGARPQFAWSAPRLRAASGGGRRSRLHRLRASDTGRHHFGATSTPHRLATIRSRALRDGTRSQP